MSIEKQSNISEESLPDSGERRKFSTGAVRDASKGKGFPHLIPPIAIRAIAKRFEDGLQKYGRANFLKGLPLSCLYDSAIRHLMAWSEGDTTEDHLGAAGWNIVVAIWTQDQISNGHLPDELQDLPYFPIK